ncbi:MAG TPA: dolichyl-phosphate beta-glucosyltransferase [Chloroflexia bacterium]|nr:dolichyl-phosphate beta-glucosyltransferase [Chloroflexia bacterium]
MQENAPRLSVVIPMYNEAHRLRRSLPKLEGYFRSRPYTVELVVVDDGSSDDTLELAREILAGHPNVNVIESKPNRGKGHAVKVGMLAARGEIVLFTDADLSTPPDEIEKFWEWFDKGYDVVIGSRKMKGAHIERHQPLWRENLGKVFTWLTNRIATRGISDITCGFKAFTHDAAQELFSRSIIDDWSFDAEVLFIAQQQGKRIKEVPVRWHDERGTKVRILRDATRAMLGLLKIRLNGLKGVYR